MNRPPTAVAHPRDSSSDDLVLEGGPITIEQVARVARHSGRVVLGAAGRQKVISARNVVEEHLADAGAHYGINTGFGSLSRRRIAPADLRDLQHNLVRSHAAGVGEPLPHDVVRGMMLVLAASLARGRSGVRPVVCEQLVGLLNADVTPIVPEIGSVGASGDLAPLAHVALVLIGEGHARAGDGGAILPGREALSAAGLAPLTLEAKEGLALINGTHLMAAQAALLAVDFRRLFDAALVAAAMAIDACRATDAFLDQRVYDARNQPGPAHVARRLRGLLAGSQIVPSHRDNDSRVQDPYSLRCAPIVLGTAWDAFEFIERTIGAELAAVTDNPLIFPGGGPADGASPSIVSAGNFHGMPLAIPLDAMAIAIAHLAGIAERRVYFMLAAADPEAQLPASLSPQPGLHSGLMIAQYTAAACCNEIIGLASPASVVNIPTSAGVEDYNSFGPRAAAKARRALDLAEHVVAIELMCAAQGVEAHRPLRSGAIVEKAITAIRAKVARLVADRPLTPDVVEIVGLIRAGAFAADKDS